MAIASGGTLGQATSSSAATSFTLTQAGSAMADGDFALLAVTTDNATAGGPQHGSISGGTGTWEKLGENVQSFATEGTTVTTSLWLFRSTGTNALNTVYTINLNATVTDKCAQMWKFTKAAGQDVRLATGATNPQVLSTAGSSGFGSSTLSGFSSANRLWFRALGKEANATTPITPTSGFTAGGNPRSRNNTNAVLNRIEFKISTATTETSNPTLTTVGDTSSVFAALEEYSPAPTTTGQIKANVGGSYIAKPVKAHISGSWTTKPLKRWNGSGWVPTNY